MNILWLVIAIASFPVLEMVFVFAKNAWKGEYYDYATENMVEIAFHKRLMLLVGSFVSAIVALCMCYPILLELKLLEKI